MMDNIVHSVYAVVAQTYNIPFTLPVRPYYIKVNYTEGLKSDQFSRVFIIIIILIVYG